MKSCSILGFPGSFSIMTVTDLCQCSKATHNGVGVAILVTVAKNSALNSWCFFLGSLTTAFFVMVPDVFGGDVDADSSRAGTNQCLG